MEVGMIYIIEDNEKEKRWMEWAVQWMCIKESRVFFVNVDRLSEKVWKMVRETECPVVLYATKRWDLLADEKKKIVFPLFAQENVGTMPGHPFSFTELCRVYHPLEEKKIPDNSFAVGAIRGGIIRTLRYALERAGTKEEKIKKVYAVEKALNIRVRISEIRGHGKDVASINAPLIAPPISDVVIPGVFITAEDVLFTYDGKVNSEAIQKLHEMEKEKKHIVLWTNGDADQARAALQGLDIRDRNGKHYPVISKRHFAGRKVGLVIDRCEDLNTFQKTYRIFPEAYIKTRGGA